MVIDSQDKLVEILQNYLLFFFISFETLPFWFVIIVPLEIKFQLRLQPPQAGQAVPFYRFLVLLLRRGNWCNRLFEASRWDRSLGSAAVPCHRLRCTRGAGLFHSSRWCWVAYMSGCRRWHWFFCTGWRLNREPAAALVVFICGILAVLQCKSLPAVAAMMVVGFGESWITDGRWWRHSVWHTTTGSSTSKSLARLGLRHLKSITAVRGFFRQHSYKLYDLWKCSNRSMEV